MTNPIIRKLREQELFDIEVALARLQFEITVCLWAGAEVPRQTISDVATLLVLKQASPTGI